MSKGRILIVEDNPVNMELFMDILSAGGYECIHTVDGEEAIGIANREQPDLILLDIQLPGMDGITVGRILRSQENTKNMKIIALTAYAMKGDKEMFLEKGFDGYISKPIKMKDFLGAVEDFLAGKSQQE
ncbi:MAG: response regulator [Nitrospirae bacterium]|nr:MAG: response regulator [Nitrospirota bacterium]